MRAVRLSWAAPALLALAACSESTPEVIDADALVVAAAPETWERLGPRIRRTLEPTPFALPGEKAFDLTHVDPSGATWAEDRQADQLLVIGSPEDPWVADLIERRKLAPPSVPSQTELMDVWDGTQYVVLLAAAGDTRLTERMMSDLRTRFDKHYRERVVERLYFPEGPNNALADTLQQGGGFDLLLPFGYRWEREGDVYHFQPPATDSSGVARHVLVTWRTPIPEGVENDAIALLDWREDLSRESYGARQTVDPAGVHGGPTTQRGSRAIQLLGTWRGGGETGPFLLRGVVCPVQDRLYLLDGWMPATEQEGREYQEYMVQIEFRMDSICTMYSWYSRPSWSVAGIQPSSR